MKQFNQIVLLYYFSHFYFSKEIKSQLSESIFQKQKSKIADLLNEKQSVKSRQKTIYSYENG